MTLGHALSHIGLVADALAAAGALCLRRRARRLAVAAALVLTPLLLGGALWKSHQVLHLRHHTALAAAGIVAALAVVAALAWLFRARPGLLALASVVALPFRFSLLSGGTGGVLLVLYAVIGGGALAVVIWGEAEERPAAGALEWALGGYVVLYAIETLYTPDLSKAVQQLGFFYVPFALLFVLLRGVHWERALLRRCAVAAVALAALFAAVGIVEYATRRLLFHVALNSAQRYFRVNSLFYDPNIYGRYLALAMVLVAAWMLWQRGRREVAAAAGVLAFLWLGLLWSVSQSSLVALLAGLAVLAVLRFPWRVAVGGVVVVAAAIAVIAAVDSNRLHLNLSDNSTSGRASLVRQGLDLFGDRPLEGFGSGSFSCEYLRHTSSPGVACGAPAIPGVTSDSHAAPVTVAAEQGVLGLLAYLAVLIAAALALARGRLRDNVARAAILAAFTALVVHSFFYADFLEDPITWTLLAVGAALFGYLKRLASAGLAYQIGDLLAKGVAVFTLPLYTHYVTASGFGYVETLFVAVILLSILLRLGVGEAFIRFYYDDEDRDRRDRIASFTVGLAFLTTTLAALLGVVFAGPLSNALLGIHDAVLFDLAMLGVWSFTNLEIAQALLRADERTGTYMRASLVNVAITIAATVYLVVGDHDGARGLLAGNFGASAVVLVGLWWVERRRLLAPFRSGARTPALRLRAMLAFGLPTVPADASVYALQVVDRWYLLRAQSAAAAGLYSLAAKLATVVFVAVRGFQYAWPPLAYSIEDDAIAARLYSLVTTYYVLATGLVVAGVALLGRWAVRLLLYKDFAAHDALPWLALGWAMYGLYLVFVVIAGRARRTNLNLPAALVGLAVNVGSLFVLVPPLGISGAGIALVIAYAAMIGVLYALTRSLFTVSFEWDRLARLLAVLVGVSVAGELLLPTSGAGGFILRGLAWCLIFPLLRFAGFFRAVELARAASIITSALLARKRGR